MNRAAFLACALVAAALPVAAKAPPAVRPVMVGGEPELDACPSVGAIIPLRKGGDGFVAVRAAPSVKARMLDKLESGRELLLCDDSADGQWVGVVYPEPFGGPVVTDCRVSSPVADKRKAYDGPCLSGWVARRFVTVIAG
ncbi:hypothetical protein [Erythrobacter oryzae]|uniref:hypothetical protein n=1 Tax=Erythrobacter oryzae TaxID=3019556 RepID=UPI0025550E61|nr:hypothetical protein [Erythrobacter sp. COR-2]